MESTQRNTLIVVVFILVSVVGVIFISLALFLAFGESRIQFTGTNVPGRISYNYQVFRGTEEGTVTLEDGDTLLVDYRFVVDNGEITLRVVDPDGEEIFEQTFSEDVAAQVALDAEIDGNYDIIVEGDTSNGGFTVTYRQAG